MEKKLKYPELEPDNYVAQVEAETAEAKKRAEQLEKQAKWDRDMALWGDMASLAAKGAAMHGGAWKINKDESAAAKGNERLRALQKENAAQLAAYAKQEVAARDAARKERNAQKLAQYNAMVEQHKRDVEAQKRAEDIEYRERKLEEDKSYHNAQLGIQGAREKRLREQGGKPRMSRNDKGDVVMPLGNGEVIIFPRQFYLDNKATILGAVRGEWEAGLDESQREMLKWGVLKAPSEKELEEMVYSSPAAAKRMLELKAKVPQGQTTDNTPPSRKRDNSNTPPSRR